MASSKATNKPLKDIPNPHPHDVLCGRGGGTNNHVGNSHWRMLVAANKQLYITLPKRQKMLLSRSIVNAVRSQNPPGRFLQKDNKAGMWLDVGDQRAQEKTSQALREGAPDIRKKVQGKGDVDSTSKSTENPGDSDSNSDEESHQDQDGSAATGNGSQEVTSASVTSSSKRSKSKSPTPSPKKPTSPLSPQKLSPIEMPSSTTVVSQNLPQAPMMNDGPYSRNMAPQQVQPQPQVSYNGQGAAAAAMPQHHQMPQQQQHMPMPMHSVGGVAGQQQQPMVYYPGPNMQPVNVYPTMILDQNGMMVPAMGIMPQHHQGMNNQQGMMNQQQQQQNQGMMNQQHQQQQQHYPNPTQLSETQSSDSNAQEANDHVEPLPAHHMPSFDDAAVFPPGSLEPGTFSFGSITMTDADQHKLESGGVSFGSAMSFTQNHHQHHQNHHNHYHHGNQYHNSNAQQQQPHQQQQQHSKNNDSSNYDDVVPHAIDGLEPTGVSFGDVSMMSVGTTKGQKLQNTGTSFGSVMSYVKQPDMVDGGLEAIGTSLGSLSLDTTNRETLYHSLEMAAAGPEIPPMFQQQRSTGNLLECSDTESDDEQDNELVAQKSAMWEKMQETVLRKSGSRTNPSLSSADAASKTSAASKNSGDQMPPPPPAKPTTFATTFDDMVVPLTHMERDFSALSAFEDDFAYDHEDNDATTMPPPSLQKQNSDGDRLEMFYFGNHNQGGGERS
jgi:hypothetical protein